MNALPFVSVVLAHPMFEPGKQLGEGVAERYVLRLVGEGPDVVDGHVKLVVVDRLRRFGCGGTPSAGRPESSRRKLSRSLGTGLSSPDSVRASGRRSEH
jgi:hypothetical protein